MNPDLEDLLAKGGRSLAAARRLFEDGHFDFAISRAYYAMFYVAEAALATKGLSYSRHSTVISAFHREFVHPGSLPAYLHKALSDAFQRRTVSDYQTMVISQEEARGILASAERFVQEVIAYLKGRQP